MGMDGVYSQLEQKRISELSDNDLSVERRKTIGETKKFGTEGMFDNPVETEFQNRQKRLAQERESLLGRSATTRTLFAGAGGSSGGIGNTEAGINTGPQGGSMARKTLLGA